MNEWQIIKFIKLIWWHKLGLCKFYKQFVVYSNFNLGNESKFRHNIKLLCIHLLQFNLLKTTPQNYETKTVVPNLFWVMPQSRQFWNPMPHRNLGMLLRWGVCPTFGMTALKRPYWTNIFWHVTFSTSYTHWYKNTFCLSSYFFLFSWF